MNKRLGLLFLILFATLFAGWWLGREDGGEAAEADLAALARPGPKPAKPVLAAAVPAEQAAAAVPEEGEPARFPGGGPDLFPAVSWRPPPPPVLSVPVAQAPPPPPMAPPLPFTYLGRWADDKGVTVFLSQGGRVLDARAGQRLDQWRLDSVGADSLGFTYVPLDQQRQLRLTP